MGLGWGSALGRAGAGKTLRGGIVEKVGVWWVVGGGG